jgi:hypothetical protein
MGTKKQIKLQKLTPSQKKLFATMKTSEKFNFIHNLQAEAQKKAKAQDKV